MQNSVQNYKKTLKNKNKSIPPFSKIAKKEKTAESKKYSKKAAHHLHK